MIHINAFDWINRNRGSATEAKLMFRKRESLNDGQLSPPPVHLSSPRRNFPHTLGSVLWNPLCYNPPVNDLCARRSMREIKKEHSVKLYDTKLELVLLNIRQRSTERNENAVVRRTFSFSLRLRCFYTTYYSSTLLPGNRRIDFPHVFGRGRVEHRISLR